MSEHAQNRADKLARKRRRMAADEQVATLKDQLASAVAAVKAFHNAMADFCRGCDNRCQADPTHGCPGRREQRW